MEPGCAGGGDKRKIIRKGIYNQTKSAMLSAGNEVLPWVTRTAYRADDFCD